MRYYEDLPVGGKFGTASVIVSEADIVAFASQFDPQVFHLDAAAEKNTLFGQLVASGWHTASLSMRLMVQGELQPAGGMIGLGIEDIKWPKPVLPGDTLRVVSEVIEARLSASKPDRGLVKIRNMTLNQHGHTVQVMTSVQIVLRRPVAP